LRRHHAPHFRRGGLYTSWHTILGFKVPDVAATVKALREMGVVFNTYEGFDHDELGIVTLPGGAIRVAWLKDPDGNVLSVTNV
jgi:hypothetical protein